MKRINIITYQGAIVWVAYLNELKKSGLLTPDLCKGLQQVALMPVANSELLIEANFAMAKQIETIRHGGFI